MEAAFRDVGRLGHAVNNNEDDEDDEASPADRNLL
jgi:hypothetical protein